MIIDPDPDQVICSVPDLHTDSVLEWVIDLTMDSEPDSLTELVLDPVIDLIIYFIMHVVHLSHL